jgi:hypothetical protein
VHVESEAAGAEARSDARGPAAVAVQHASALLADGSRVPPELALRFMPWLVRAAPELALRVLKVGCQSCWHGGAQAEGGAHAHLCMGGHPASQQPRGARVRHFGPARASVLTPPLAARVATARCCNGIAPSRELARDDRAWPGQPACGPPWARPAYVFVLAVTVVVVAVVAARRPPVLFRLSTDASRPKPPRQSTCSWRPGPPRARAEGAARCPAGGDGSAAACE